MNMFEKKHSRINEQESPRFNTIEELRAYYDCVPFDDFAKSIGCLEEYNQRINDTIESDREQEEFIEQCRRELEARVIELRNKKQ